MPNIHNSRTFSGVEQIFVVNLTVADKIELIRKMAYGICFSEISPRELKLSIGFVYENGMIYDDQRLSDDEKMSDAEKNQYLRIPGEANVVPIDPKKSKFNIKTQGEDRGKSFESEITAFVPGSGENTFTWLYSFLAMEKAIIFKDANSHWRIMFDPVYRVEMDFEQDSGEGLAASAGFTVTFKNQSKYPPLYFYGNIVVTIPGTQADSSEIVIKTYPNMYQSVPTVEKNTSAVPYPEDMYQSM